MSNPKNDIRLKELILKLRDAGLPVSLEQTSEYSISLDCSYMLNANGSMRWIYPSASKTPEFLRFYHSNNLRSTLIKTMISTGFSIGAKKMLGNGSFTLYCNNSLKPWLNNWALFATTAFTKDKVLLWHMDAVKKSLFTRFAFSPKASAELQDEAAVLRSAGKLSNELISAPACLSDSAFHFTQTDVMNERITKTDRINQIPLKALTMWLETDLKEAPIANSKWFEKTIDTAENINSWKDKRIAESFCVKYAKLTSFLKSRQSMPVSTAHGDFTPWNIYIEQDKLVMIDWELFETQMPALYDVFHFVYQSNSLAGLKPYSQIRKELDELFAQPQWQKFIRKNNISTDLAEQCYLAKVVSHYLPVYAKQQAWDAQVKRSLSVWNEALTYWLNRSSVMPVRKIVLHDAMFYLHDMPYAAMKFIIETIDDLSEASDMDICIEKKNGEKLIALFKKNTLIKQVKVISKTYMKQVELLLNDNSLLYFDLINDFKRKQWNFLNAKKVIGSSVENPHGVRVAGAAFDFLYTMQFYQLNNSDIPEKYSQWFKQYEKQIMPVVNKALPGLGMSYDELQKNDKEKTNKIFNHVKEQPGNKGLSKLGNQLAYCWDNIRNMKPSAGYIITFSGVDGAGKTTIINKTKNFLEKNLRRKVVVLRHRPSVLPMLSAWKHGREAAEQMSANTMPRQGKNKSSISSLFRFVYYYTDYLLGQFYVQAKYVWRGNVVVYDRYYFDFINDSRRSNIDLPKPFTSWLYRLLVKPEINFFLYAPAETILKRKQEMDEASIKTLTADYLDLFESLSGRYKRSSYISISNIEMTETLSTVFEKIRIQHLN
ncbi:MAG TPA: hypothetical protein PKM63_15935 [Panacibacter sp.]|nr:hypothetical protein [Panacibacter sp.]HNP45782.1 hypothetical protein [Panacibacter sp.]